MKLAFSSNAFRRFTLQDSIAILSTIGYDGIEIMADIPHAYPPNLTKKDIGSIQDALKRHGMEVSNINAFMLRAIGDVYRPSWIERDRKSREERINHTLSCIDLADMLGARTISTEPGGPLEQGASADEALDIFREGLSMVEARAREKGVRVLIEPEPGLLIQTGSDFQRLYSELDPDVFGLNFDIGHFFCVREDCASLIEKLGGAIHHFHLDDISSDRKHYHLMPGSGIIDFKSILSAVKKIDYQGFLTVELYTYEESPSEAALRSLNYIRGVMGIIND